MYVFNAMELMHLNMVKMVVFTVFYHNINKYNKANSRRLDILGHARYGSIIFVLPKLLSTIYRMLCTRNGFSQWATEVRQIRVIVRLYH